MDPTKIKHDIDYCPKTIVYNGFIYTIYNEKHMIYLKNKIANE